MLDDAVLQPGLSRRQAEEYIVVYPELGADPAAAGLGRDPVAPALWHQLRHSSRDIPSALPRMRLERSMLLVKRVLAEWRRDGAKEGAPTQDRMRLHQSAIRLAAEGRRAPTIARSARVRSRRRRTLSLSGVPSTAKSSLKRSSRRGFLDMKAP